MDHRNHSYRDGWLTWNSDAIQAHGETVQRIEAFVANADTPLDMQARLDLARRETLLRFSGVEAATGVERIVDEFLGFLAVAGVLSLDGRDQDS